MTTPLPPFLQSFATLDAAFVERIAQIREDACYTAGALPVKTKLLIALALDLYSASELGTATFAARAREAGATDAEIIEVVELCYSVAGLQQMANAVHAFPPKA